MKSLNIKIPVPVAQRMDDNAQLNPVYLTQFIIENIDRDYSLDKPISELCYNYTFKIDDGFHKLIKLKAIELDLPMNDLVGRLLVKFYQ